MDELLKKQYTNAYGVYRTGDYPIGSHVRYRASGQISTGEVVWSCISATREYTGKFVYVLSTSDSVFPLPVLATSVIGEA